MKAVKISLSSEHIEIVKRILNDNCTGEDCITRKEVFRLLQKERPLNIEEYKFNLLLTKAIISGRILGFETKAGRNGGIRRSVRPNTVRENVRQGLRKFGNLKADDEQVVDFVTKLVE
jgi:hypothetical protein